LEMVGIDASDPEGGTLYQAAVEYFQIPQERLGVPTLIIDDTVLVGSNEIPAQFPGLIDYYLAQGGVDWPDIPGMAEALAESMPEQSVEHPPVQTEEVLGPPPPSEEPTDPTENSPSLDFQDSHDLSWQEKFSRDLAGSTLAVIVLTGMLIALAGSVIYLTRSSKPSSTIVAHSLIPILCIIGLFVAGYLAYVETARVSAVCGPIGDCNTVQQSEYASLFGIIPIGVLGLFGYILILLAWLGMRISRNSVQYFSAVALFGMTSVGTLFSIYLTFLEPFVIGANCAWCLTSAILMTVLMLLSLKPGKNAIQMYIKHQDH